MYDSIIFNTIKGKAEDSQDSSQSRLPSKTCLCERDKPFFLLIALAHKLCTHRSFRSICPLKHVQAPNEIRVKEGLETQLRGCFYRRPVLELMSGSLPPPVTSDFCPLRASTLSHTTPLDAHRLKINHYRKKGQNVDLMIYKFSSIFVKKLIIYKN